MSYQDRLAIIFQPLLHWNNAVYAHHLDKRLAAALLDNAHQESPLTTSHQEIGYGRTRDNSKARKYLTTPQKTDRQKANSSNPPHTKMLDQIACGYLLDKSLLWQ